MNLASMAAWLISRGTLGGALANGSRLSISHVDLNKSWGLENRNPIFSKSVDFLQIFMRQVSNSQ